MDWTDPAQLMQALLVCCCVFALMFGFRAGDKT